jgi:ThiF family
LRGAFAVCGWWHVLLRRRKTAVMNALVRGINRAVRFTAVPYFLPAQLAIDALKTVDAIVGCLDTLHARADLQEIAWRYLVPYVDIGLKIVPKSVTAGLAIGGNVATSIPGSFCPWCIDFLSQNKLDSKPAGGHAVTCTDRIKKGKS